MPEGGFPLPAMEPRVEPQGHAANRVDQSGPGRVVDDRHGRPHGLEPAGLELADELLGCVLDPVIGIREREEPRTAELLPPGRRAIRTGYKETSVRLQYASDLAENRDPWVQMLDDIEKQRGVERRIGKRERAREVPGEELHVVEALATAARGRDPELRDVVIDADDALRPAGRADRMATVGAPHIEHDRRGAQVVDVPVVPRRLNQVFRVYEVPALARVADEAHAHRLAAAVYGVDRADERPGPARSHRRPARGAARSRRHRSRTSS